MANRKMSLSMEGKETLDLLLEHIDCDRPFGVKLALAKGIANANGDDTPSIKNSTGKWTIPDNIIREDDYLLFKHLIINEIGSTIGDEEVDKSMILYIEYGLGIIKEEISNLSSLEDYRIKILE
ncbi:hypothetical protein RYX45_05830 [Alkalihalophilus pseudofirmus]|uniref:Uncharacterized protein n=1 Tax=Alkalihalophilus pseudofirmus TaxID=79885 RepID=A0AAJ2NKU7_ALKPS|nr:hypothetical protein [Alkalihalophilus pseudofirmus]MDV2884689.1 hypothetical protein [Alkalihalophilus pseudofirmus]